MIIAITKLIQQMQPKERPVSVMVWLREHPKAKLWNRDREGNLCQLVEWHAGEFFPHAVHAVSVVGTKLLIHTSGDCPLEVEVDNPAAGAKVIA